MISKGFKISAIVLALFLAPFFAAQAQAFGPKPEDIKILDVIAGGPGCPQGTYSVLISSSVPGGPADLFEIIYDGFEVQKGPNVPFSEGRKFCNVAVDLLIPNGFRFSLASVHYEGYASIPYRSAGQLKTEYFFPFFSNRVSTAKTLNGPFDGDYRKEDTLALLSAVFSPCGQKIPLNMKTTLQLDGPRRDAAYMTVDLQTGLLTQVWALQWQTCGN